MSDRITIRTGAEFLGTFLFVLVGAGSALGAGASGPADATAALVVAALGNGIGLAVAITATMAVSGGSLNPAVTLALFAARKLPARDVIPYIIAELLGGTLAVVVLIAIFPAAIGRAVSWGMPSLLPALSPAQGIALEAVMSAFLMAAVFGTAVSQGAPKVGGFGIGLAVVADVLLGGPFTGAAMNPARAMGPMVASLTFPGYWYIYWIGPIVGTIVVGIAYRFLSDVHSSGSQINN